MQTLSIPVGDKGAKAVIKDAAAFGRVVEHVQKHGPLANEVQLREQFPNISFQLKPASGGSPTQVFV